MRVRELRESDVPALTEMARASGFPYPDLESAAAKRVIESIRVVVDDEDRPVMAAAVKRIIEVYLFSGNFNRPLAKKHALRMLHEDMAIALKERGYDSIEAFIPPAIAERFARRLEKSFGWTHNWPSWNRRF